MSYFYTNITSYGDYIYCLGYRDGKRFCEKTAFSPTFYIPTRDETNFKTIEDTYLKPLKFDSIKKARNWVKEMEDVDNFKFFGTTNYCAQFVLEEFGDNVEYDTSLINIGTLDIEVESDDGFPVPELAAHPIITIGHHNSKTGIYHVWGLKEYDISICKIKNFDKSKIRYYKCDSEHELLFKFLTWWADFENVPDILTGWFTRMFDIPYLINRIKNTMGETHAKKLSPVGRIKEKSERIKNSNKEAQVYEIDGISQLDYKEVFEKFSFSFGKQESYTLDHIAHVVLGENKLSYEEHGNLHTLYKKDPQKFVDYNIRDVQLVVRMQEELDFIGIALSIAYRAGCNYIDSLGTVKIWDNIVYRDFAKKGYVTKIKKYQPKMSFPGGYVKSPKIGKSKWIASFDLASQYPNLLIQYNMSPETITGDIEEGLKFETLLAGDFKNTSKNSISASGVHFNIEKRGMIPALVKGIFEERKVFKAEMFEKNKELEKIKKKIQTNDTPELRSEMGLVKTKATLLDNQQHAIKILMNSLYGALGNPGFLYFDVRVTTAITTSGQLSILWAEKSINNYLNSLFKTNDDYIIAIDTDSLYVDLSKLVDKIYGDKANDPANTSEIIDFMDKVCSEKILPVLKKSYEKLYELLPGFENRMEMDREVLADSGIWTAKKKYILNIHDNEGVRYSTPKLKVSGIEAIKSSTPQHCRNKLKESFNIVISGTENDMHKFIAEFKKDFFNLEPHEVAFPRSVSNLTDRADPKTIYGKATPIHVRGSLLYNYHIKQKNLEKLYEEIKAGEKIKFFYLKIPNTIHENVIAFPQYLPEELGLHPFIDYEKQFEKSFISPLKNLLDKIGWTTEKVNTLESFFG